MTEQVIVIVALEPILEFIRLTESVGEMELIGGGVLRMMLTPVYRDQCLPWRKKWGC